MEMEQGEKVYTGSSLKMRISYLGIQREGSYLWLMLERIRMEASSSLHLESVNGWTVNTLSLEKLLKVLTSLTKWSKLVLRVAKL